MRIPKEHIQPQHVPECLDARESLWKHLDQLVRMTKHYPVICSFSDFKFIFTSMQDILDVIVWLNQELAWLKRELGMAA